MNALPKKSYREHQGLQRIIAGLAEGVILIDPEQNILWANDAALAMHGVGQLGDLGDTVKDYRKRFRLRYRNRHSLKPGEYPTERVSEGEEFSDVMVEVSRIDNPERRWIHAVRGFVIKDDKDTPDYAVLVVDDETERFEAEDRFESAFNANPAPAVICRLSDLRYIKVNPGFLEMTGYAREKLIGRSIYEIDVLSEAVNRNVTVECLKKGEIIPQTEARLPLPNGDSKFVIVAGEPIEVQDEECVLFTFADLDPRMKAEEALRQSEERFEKSFRLSPVAAAICALDGFKVIDANDAYIKMTGYAEEEIMGRSPSELGVWPDRAAQERFREAVVKDAGMQNFDIRVRGKDGTVCDCLLSAETVTINDRRCVLCVMQDITERKRSEEELIDAIEAVMADTSWFSHSIVEKLAALRQTSRAVPLGSDLDDLTARERDVLGLICEGQTDPQMSETLKLSCHTIRNHVSALFRKIGVNRRSAAIIWARERGIAGKDALKRRKPSKR